MSPSYHRAGCQDIESSVTTSAQTLSVGNRGNYYHTHCWCGNRDQYVTSCTYCWCGNRDQYVTNCTYCWCWNRDQYVTNCTYCWCGNRDQYVTNCTYCWCGNRDQYVTNCTYCWCGNRDQYVTNCTYCWCGNRDQYVTNCTYCWCWNRDQYVTNCTYCWCGNRDQYVTNCTNCWLGTETSTLPIAHTVGHTPSTAFRHLPPNSARFSYATEGALFLSAQLSSDAASALRKFPVASTVRLTVRSNLAPKHARKHETHPPRVPSLFKRLWFYLCWCKLCWRI